MAILAKEVAGAEFPEVDEDSNAATLEVCAFTSKAGHCVVAVSAARVERLAPVRVLPGI